MALKKSKHIDIRFHYISEKSIDVNYVTTNENAADILIKLLAKQKHMYCCILLKLKITYIHNWPLQPFSQDY